MNKYQQVIIARKPYMEAWFKKPLQGGLGLEKDIEYF